MKASWLHATLLSLFLLGSALPEKQNECKDIIPSVQQVEVHDNFSVPCPSFTSLEMTFKLYKDGLIMEHCTVLRNFTVSKEPWFVKSTISHHVNAENNSTMFVLSNVTEDEAGLYSCEAQNTFPPPILTTKEKPLVVVIMKGTHSPSIHCEAPANHLSLWVGLGLLSLYGLIITYAAFSLRSRLTRVDFNKHDYMNMKPKARRKNQGILYPTRMSWYRDNTVSIAPCKLPSTRTQN